MRCRRARRIAARAVDDRWTLDERFALEEHVGECPDCARDYERLARVEDLLQRLPEPPLDRLDVEDAARAIAARLAPAAAASDRAATRAPRWVAAAALLAAVVGVFQAFERADAPGPTVTDAAAAPPLETGPRDASSERAPSAGVAVPPASLPGAPAELTDRTGPTEPAQSTGPVDPIDEGRLAEVRSATRALLASLGAELAPGAPSDRAAELARDLDERARPWADEGWPVTRLVTGALADGSPTIRRAALRYLGQRGDRVGVTALERHLVETAEDAPEAACALLDAFERGFPLSGELVRRTELVDLALERVARASSARAGEPAPGGRLAAAVAELLKDGPGRDVERAWIPALARLGQPGVVALCDLGLRRVAARPAVVRALAGRARHPALVLELERLGRRDLDWARELCAALRSPGMADWLAARVADESGGTWALELLVELAGPRALDHAVDLWGRGRLGPGGPPACLVDRLERDPAELESSVRATLAAGLEGRADDRLPTLIECAIAADTPAALPALCACVRSPLADRPLRRAAAGAIAELERAPWVADGLVDQVRRLGADEAPLAAALLVPIHADRGLDGLRAALPDAPETLLGDVEHELLTSGHSHRRAAALVRIARSIGPALDGRLPATRTRP